MDGTATESDQEIGDQLRILAVNKRSWHHSRAGGAEFNLEETLKRLSERGHQIHLLVGSDEGRQKVEQDGSVSIRRVGFDHRFPQPWDVVFAYIAVSLYFYWEQFRISPDVVYAVNSPLPWLVLSRRPKVTIFHHLAIDSIFETHPFPQNILGYLAQRVGVLLERNNPTVSVSRSTTSELVSRGHDPDTVYEIKNGLDIDRYSIGEKSETPTITYVGAMERYKGVDRLPAIHRALRDIRGSDVRLDIAGRDGPARDRIERYCTETTNAYYHGFVSESEKIGLLQSAWVFVAPSRVEGYGLAVIEANACGTPAVGSDVKGLRDSIRDGETGLLVDASDPEMFASKVNELLSNDGKRKEFSSRAQSWAMQHDWKHSIDKFENLFISVTPD